MSEPLATQQPQWVRLYTAPQTETADMPSSVVGLLIKETPYSYVLHPMLDVVAEDGVLEYKEVGTNAINKTYVWRCQILASMPEKVDTTQYAIGGGLG